MKYEVILFDADETLFDFRRAEREALAKTIGEYGMDYQEAYHLKIYQEINHQAWKDLEEGRITQDELKVIRFKRLSEALGVAFDEHAFGKSYMAHLAQGSFLYEGVESLIEALSHNFRLMIITNGLTDVQNKRIKQSTIAHFFEGIIVSEEVGVAKPNPQIFQLALDHLGHRDKATVLMVGDSLSSDILGGINFGIDTCWYNPEGASNSGSLQPTYEIHELPQLMTILGMKG